MKVIARIERWTKRQGMHGFAGPRTPVDNRIRDLIFLRAYIEDLHRRIASASFLLYDHDGYEGNAKELARLVEEAFIVLQGRSWKEMK